MPSLPIIDVTDTHLQILDMRAIETTPAHQDLMDWCTAHDIDPNRIPANAPIQIDRAAQTITYERDCLDPGGRRMHSSEHGFLTETVTVVMDAIVPWPDSVLALAASHVVTDTPLQDALAEIDRLQDKLKTTIEAVILMRDELAKFPALPYELRTVLAALNASITSKEKP